MVGKPKEQKKKKCKIVGRKSDKKKKKVERMREFSKRIRIKNRKKQQVVDEISKLENSQEESEFVEHSSSDDTIEITEAAERNFLDARSISDELESDSCDESRLTSSSRSLDTVDQSESAKDGRSEKGTDSISVQGDLVEINGNEKEVVFDDKNSDTASDKNESVSAVIEDEVLLRESVIENDFKGVLGEEVDSKTADRIDEVENANVTKGEGSCDLQENSFDYSEVLTTFAEIFTWGKEQSKS